MIRLVGPQGRPILVFGGGGHARSVVDALVRAGADVRGIVAPDVTWLTEVAVIGSDDEGIRAALDHGWSAAAAIGDNARRLGLVRRLLDAGLDVAGFTAVTATVAVDARLAEGTVVLEHAHVGPGARVGAAGLVNTSAVVEHDTTLGDGVHVAPGALIGGAATCGDGVMIGAGAAVLPGIRIGEWSVLGAGCVATADIAPRGVFVGVPARLLRPLVPPDPKVDG